MRTLKKSLALVLALVMVLGLAVVGASADNAIDKFEDSDQIGDAYLEAVGVLTGLGIVDGMTDTEIAPQGTYQRDQAAKIIAYMVLGKEAADSLVASYAPFQDVPADYWAAGYIAFCKEQGIIDGVSDTSFDPYGTLTGFQWAKMLLAAVGFNAKNELEGDSWSLNTARTGHEVGLFDGDIAGADHVALRREQAMLYAFNTLTSVRQVSYTGNGNNYVYDIFGYEWADGTGYTLGAEVFDLTYVEGIIIDNEGMGASATYVDNSNYNAPSDDLPDWWDDIFGADEAVVEVSADTGIDLMYHAVRVWYVDDADNTSAYVYDLAETTVYECGDMEDGQEAYDDLSASNQAGEPTIGDYEDSVPYESYLINNTALDEGYYYVTVEYALGTIGVPSTVNETLVIDLGETKAPAVPNSKIKTDVSDMDYLDEVMVLRAKSTEEGTSAYAYYLYAPTTTTGVITRINNNGTVVLRDGTEIAESNLTTVDLDSDDIGVAYTFVLDTHGHYYDVSTNLNLVYFTGSYSREWGEYTGETVYEAQVVNVQTGDDSLVLVDDDNIRARQAGYYWLEEANLNGVYELTPWASSYTARGSYVYDSSETFDRTSGVLNMWTSYAPDGEDVYYSADSVRFIIASGSGTTLDIAEYDGVAELLEAYNATGSYGSVTLGNGLAVTTSRTDVGNLEATIVFAYEVDATSRYVFIPENVESTSWDHMIETNDGDVLWYYDGAYLNGVATTIYYDHAVDLTRGFYSVEVDENGLTMLREAWPMEWYYEAENIVRVGDIYAQDSEYFGLTDFADDAVIFDARPEVLDEKPTLDAISALDLFRYYREQDLQLAYTLDMNGDIDVCYVVDWNLGVLTNVNVTATNGQSNAAPGYTWDNVSNSNRIWEDKIEVVLNLNNGVTVEKGQEFDVTYDFGYSNNDGTNYTTVYDQTATAVATDTDEILVTVQIPNAYRGNYAYRLTITDVVFPDFTVTMANNMLDADGNALFNMWWNIGAQTNEGVVNGLSYTFEDVTPGTQIGVGFVRESAANLLAEVVATGLPEDVETSVTFANDGGNAWVRWTPTSVNNITVTDIVATYEFTLNDEAAAYLSMGSQAAADADSIALVATAGDELTVYVTHDDLEAHVGEHGSDTVQLTFGGNDAFKAKESASDAFNAANGATRNTFTFEGVTPTVSTSTQDATDWTNNVTLAFPGSVGWVTV